MSRVLVVDDDRAATEGLRALLRLDGYDVVALQSSKAALGLLASDRFDAVITDLEMPEVHGVDIVRAARAARTDMPILVVTAYSQSPACQAALDAGARCILTKPIDFDILSTDLQAAIAGHAERPKSKRRSY